MPSNHRTSTREAPPRRPKKAEPEQQPLASPSRAELAVGFSQALDLAEGRAARHAARVCYIALNLAESAGLPAAEREAAFYGALLHDAGAAPASSDACRTLNISEEAFFAGPPGRSPQQLALEIAPARGRDVVEVLRSHLELGAGIARELGFDEAVQAAVRGHHERWDGQGYPGAQKGEASSVAARLVAAADVIESLIASETNALSARRSIMALLAEHGGRSIDPAFAQAARELVRSDSFWLGLHDEELARGLAAAAGANERAEFDVLLTFASVFAALADSKGEHTAGHSQRTAELARTLGEGLDLDEQRCRLLYVAALCHDIGLLGVAARVIAKPDILSLSEMELMRRHPTCSQLVLETIPGLEAVALWAGAHHERPDGKGYPELLEGDGIPLEARIIALADTYVALTSPRPYRRALSAEDAQQVLIGGAGTQLDRELVQFFCGELAATSSRSAPRAARRR